MHRDLGILIDLKLEMTHYTDMVIAKGNHTLAPICTLRNNLYGVTFLVAPHLIFSLLLLETLWASRHDEQNHLL